MDRDELEFLISQHLDGTLGEADVARLEAMVLSDPEGQALLNEHTRLDAALRASRTALAIDENWLSGQIGDAIDEANAAPLKISRFTWAAPLAMAATLLIGLTLGIIFLQDDSTPTQVAIDTPKQAPAIIELVIAGPKTTLPAATGFASISVGVPANMTPQIVSALYLSRDLSNGRVSIRAAGPHQDAFE